MKKLIMAALLMASACAAQAGGSASATMDVRFVIRAACSVEAGAADPAPRVQCTQGTAYQLRSPSAPAPVPVPVDAEPRDGAATDQVWQVVF